MAFNPAPSAHIAGWSEDATDITCPIASVPEITAAEADGTTGDIRKVIYAFCKKFYALYTAMATADKPGKMTVTESNTISGDTITRVISFRFVTGATGIEVADET